jgi:hypothetical protein
LERAKERTRFSHEKIRKHLKQAEIPDPGKTAFMEREKKKVVLGG